MARADRHRDVTARRASRDEAFRVLRSNLLVAIDDLANPVVVVTSAQEGEGKTTTSVGLARSLALAGPRVVLVDLDLRRPDAHRLLGADNVPGVAEVLQNRRELKDCLQFLPPPKGSPSSRGLYFVPAGQATANPAELLATPRAGRLLEALAIEADGSDLTTDRLAALDRIALTFSKMIDSEPVAERAVRQLRIDADPSDIVDETYVAPEPATQLIYVSVRDDDADLAQQLANALADSFVEAVQEFEPGDTATGVEGSVPRLPVYVFERAQVPTDPDPSNQVSTIVLATFLGLISGIALTLLIDYLDVSLRNAADVERRLELPVLGVIPALGGDATFAGRPAAGREHEAR